MEKEEIDVKETIIANLVTFVYWGTALIVLVGGYLLVQRLENEVNYLLGILIVTTSSLKLLSLSHFRIWLKSYKEK